MSEHEYAQFGYKQLIDAGVGLLQPDVMSMGGLIEFSKVVVSPSIGRFYHSAIHKHRAARKGKCIDLPRVNNLERVVELGCSNAPRLRRLRSLYSDGLWTYQRAEFMMMSESEPLPDRGYNELPTTRGVGLELNRDEVNLIRPYDRSGIQ
jgi:hypothetical protein